MKRKITTVILVVIFLAGLSLLLYPTVSNWWNEMHQSRAVASYVGKVSDMKSDEYRRLLEDAQAYNTKLAKKANRFFLTDEEKAEYESLLDVSGTGIMGYVNIPIIDVTLPIYHGTDEAILQIAVGHIAGSSLPVGGESSHCVISGHRGLPSAKLFTNIDKLTIGDTFTLNVLDEILTYEVDQIRIVLPHEAEELEIVKGEDYCTLVTCTPYGVNTHRLLVRGRRIETKEVKNIRVTADAVQIETTTVIPFVAVPLLVIWGAALGITTRKRRKNQTKEVSV